MDKRLKVFLVIIFLLSSTHSFPSVGGILNDFSVSGEKEEKIKNPLIFFKKLFENLFTDSQKVKLLVFAFFLKYSSKNIRKNTVSLIKFLKKSMPDIERENDIKTIEFFNKISVSERIREIAKNIDDFGVILTHEVNDNDYYGNLQDVFEEESLKGRFLKQLEAWIEKLPGLKEFITKGSSLEVQAELFLKEEIVQSVENLFSPSKIFSSLEVDLIAENELRDFFIYQMFYLGLLDFSSFQCFIKRVLLAKYKKGYTEQTKNYQKINAEYKEVIKKLNGIETSIGFQIPTLNDIKSKKLPQERKEEVERKIEEYRVQKNKLQEEKEEKEKAVIKEKEKLLFFNKCILFLKGREEAFFTLQSIKYEKVREHLEKEQLPFLAVYSLLKETVKFFEELSIPLEKPVRTPIEKPEREHESSKFAKFFLSKKGKALLILGALVGAYYGAWKFAPDTFLKLRKMPGALLYRIKNSHLATTIRKAFRSTLSKSLKKS